eukprot:10347191-Alexandrium_andersonii.AAC.1
MASSYLFSSASLGLASTPMAVGSIGPFGLLVFAVLVATPGPALVNLSSPPLPLPWSGFRPRSGGSPLSLPSLA